jgi:hypothetical protein
MMARNVFRFMSLALWATLPGGHVVVAEDFRVDTDVFLEDNAEEPIAETLTLFSRGIVYDFILSGSEEITIFDVDRGNLVLLDTERQMKTSLTTQELLSLSAKMKVLVEGEKLAEVFFPEFVTQFDVDGPQLVLTSPRLTYRVTATRPKLATAAERFRQFADWYARLNALRPGNMPPFARLELNSALADRELVPEEIEREVVLEGRFANKKTRVRSKHSFVWLLSGTDRKRIEKADRLRAEYSPAVSLAEYWRIPALATQ